MKAFWEDRYGVDAYAYGKEANAFLAEHLPQYEPGKLLLPAEGEGRNAVFAARLGWEVTAFDYSQAAKEKAIRLAAKEGVSIRYELADVHAFAFPQMAFDAAALIFAHLPPADRRFLHQQVWESLKPGGMLFLEAFSKSQLGRSSGGPKRTDMLFSISELQEDFTGAELLSLEETQAELSEGPYHQGLASLVRLIARKN